MKVRLIIIQSCLLVLFLAFDLAAQTRIAILGDVERNRAEIDCLTERLSKDSNIALVERSEIDKIIQEQKLSLLSEDTDIKLGAMLGAKGVIVIKSFEWEGKNILSARLVASESGAVTGFWIQDTPSDEAFHFADAVKFAFTPLFNKLNLNRKEVTALSILDIRAAVASPESKELERKITLLLSQRLMLEKSFVVLERWRLSNIAWEKELNIDRNKFWTGSCILDGSVESILDGKGTVKVALRLRKPGQKLSDFITVSGSTSDLKALVESMIPLLKTKLGADSSGPAVSWNMNKEAEFYFNEAQWLLHAGSFERAREAADAASIMGKKGPEADFLRIKSYLGELGYSREEEKIKKREQKKQKKSLEAPEIALQEDLDKLVQALDIYVKFVEAGPESLPGKFEDQTDWRMMGNDLMRVSSGLLKESLNQIKTLNSANKESKKLQEKVNLLRLLIRKAVSLTMKKGDDSSTMENFYHTYLISLIDLLFDTPQDIIAEYERIITREFPVQPTMHYKILMIINKKLKMVNGDVKVKKGRKPVMSIDLGDCVYKIAQDLESSGTPRGKIDALFLSGEDASSEKISDILWEYREQIANSYGVAGDCPEVLIRSDSCPREIIVKLLLYALSKDYPLVGGTINALLDKLIQQNKTMEDSAKDNLEVAKAWYSYWERVKIVLETKPNISIRDIIERKIAKLSEYRPGNGKPGGSSNLSPLFSSSMSEFFPHNSMKFMIESTSCPNKCLQVSGYFLEKTKKSKTNRPYLICHKEDGAKLDFICAPFTSRDSNIVRAGLIIKADENFYAASHTGDIYVSEKGGDWKILKNTGFKKVTAMTFSHNKLYVSYGHFYNRNDQIEDTIPSAIVEIDVNSGEMKIIASSRRNPAESPLDNCPAWYVFTLECSDNGMLFARIMTGNQPYHWAIYILDIAKNKWKHNSGMYVTGVSKEFGYTGVINIAKANAKYAVPDMKKGVLKKINLSPFGDSMHNDEQEPLYNDERSSVITTTNSEKVFRISQLDENYFDVQAINFSDKKLLGMKFAIDSKTITPSLKFLRGFAASDKTAYIILGTSQSGYMSEAHVFAFDLNSILNPIEADKDKIKPALETFEAVSPPASLKPGMLLNFYRGAWYLQIPDTLQMTPTSSQIVSNMKAPPLEWNENAVCSLRGYFKAEKEGVYSFSKNRCSYCAVHIDEKSPRHIPRSNQSIPYEVILKPGLHSIRVDILMKHLTEKFEITVKTPDEDKYKSVDGLVFYNSEGN